MVAKDHFKGNHAIYVYNKHHFISFDARLNKIGLDTETWFKFWKVESEPVGKLLEKWKATRANLISEQVQGRGNKERKHKNGNTLLSKTLQSIYHI